MQLEEETVDDLGRAGLVEGTFGAQVVSLHIFVSLSSRLALLVGEEFLVTRKRLIL